MTFSSQPYSICSLDPVFVLKKLTWSRNERFHLILNTQTHFIPPVKLSNPNLLTVLSLSPFLIPHSSPLIFLCASRVGFCSLFWSECSVSQRSIDELASTMCRSFHRGGDEILQIVISGVTFCLPDNPFPFPVSADLSVFFFYLVFRCRGII